VVFAGYDGLEWSDERRGGFLAAMHTAGLWRLGQPPPCVPFSVSKILNEHGNILANTSDKAGAHCAAWLKIHPVDVVICANDAMAQALLKRSPRPMPLVVSFDNSQWAREHQVISLDINHRLIAEALLTELKRDDAGGDPRMIGVPTILPRR